MSDEAKSVAEVVRKAREGFELICGKNVEAISSVGRDDGRWRVGMEVVELERIPDSTSLLASYEVVVDSEGNLLEYDRLRRYYRNRADEEL